MALHKIFLKEINTFIQQWWIQLIKSDSKYILMLQNINISNKWCSFELSLRQRIQKNYITVFDKISSIHC